MQEMVQEADSKSPVAMAIYGMFLIAFVGALIFAKSFLMPVILAFMLSLTVSPIRRWLQRRGVHPVVTASAVVLSMLLLVGGFTVALSDPINEYTTNRTSIMMDVETKLRGLSEVINKISEASDQVESIATGEDNHPPADKPEKVVVDEPSLVAKAALNAPFMLAQSLLMLVLLFFLISSGDLFYEKLVKASPTFSDKKRAIEIAYDIEYKISRYFLTITAINACLGITIGVVLWSLGMPNPVVFGAMAFAFNFVPYLGAIVGVGITLAIGIVSFDEIGSAFLAAGAYLACTSIEGQFITPFLVGRSLKLNPVIVFVAVAFWGWAWSVIGMFIAVPVLLAIRAFSESVPGLENIAVFLSGREDDEAEPPGKTAGGRKQRT